MNKNTIKMSKIMSILVILVVAFTGCEAGLTTLNNEESENSGFSFSDLYSNMNKLQNQVNKLSSDMSTGQANQLAFYKKVSAPVGSIVAWHKSLESVSIPEGWVECNGQIITGSESIYNNKKIPDLNGGMFLRGSSSSGAFQEDATAVNGLKMSVTGAHTHGYNYHADWDTNMGGNPDSDGTWSNLSRIQTGSAGNHSHALSGNTETRPVNMSVVWIMRIK
ncbi:MAG: tail fiber protein [bacterium]|nr:tail fiber protein [bacterium]